MPYAIAGNRPIVFTDDKGKVHVFGLSQVEEDPLNNRKFRFKIGFIPDAALETKANALLNVLYESGQIRRLELTLPPLKPLLDFKAKTSGAAGNDISLTFDTPEPGTPQKIPTTLTVETTYPGLTLATLNAALADNLLLKIDTDATLPAVSGKLPAEGVYPLAGGSDGATPAEAKISINDNAAGTGKSFHVIAKDKGAKWNKLQVAVSHVITGVSGAPGTFDLKVSYLPDTEKIDLNGSLPGNFNGKFGSLVEASWEGGAAPATITAPVRGKVTLSGGAEKMDARPATGAAYG